MHTIKFSDLESTVLDTEEKELVERIVREEFVRVASRISDKLVPTPNGYVSGDKFFDRSEVFADQIGKFPVEAALSLVQTIENGSNELSKQEPDFFELPFLNGKNLLAALENVEQHVVANRDYLSSSPQLRGLRDFVMESYDRIEGYLTTAITLFEQFSSKSDHEDSLKAYDTHIRIHLAQLYRRKARFILQQDPDPKDVTEKTIEKVLTLAGKSIDLYDALFKDGVYMDEREAAGTAANLANAMKLLATEENRKKALGYYEEARKILGDIPEISQGIEYYQSLPITLVYSIQGGGNNQRIFLSVIRPNLN